MNWKKSLWALMLGSSMALAACGGDNIDEDMPEESPSQELEDMPEQTAPIDEEATTTSAGEEVYQQSCISCHGENLEGGFGPALDTAGAELTEEEILSVIENGKGQMPPNIVEGEDAQAVAAWLAEKK